MAQLQPDVGSEPLKSTTKLHLENWKLTSISVTQMLKWLGKQYSNDKINFVLAVYCKL